MRFDLPSYDRLRLAVIARRQRAWDTERDGPEPRQPPLTWPVIAWAAFWLGAVTVVAWYWLNR